MNDCFNDQIRKTTLHYPVKASDSEENNDI